MYKRILVPTDGSAASDLAVNGAIEFARACGSEIVAFSVAQPFPINAAAEGAMVIDEAAQMALIMNQAEENVRRVAEAAAKAGVKCTTATVCAHHPADEIIGAAKRSGCDLVFMGSHGRRGLSRLLAGSVTQNVLAYSPLPVMVLRPQAARPAAGEDGATPDTAALDLGLP